MRKLFLICAMVLILSFFVLAVAIDSQRKESRALRGPVSSEESKPYYPPMFKGQDRA